MAEKGHVHDPGDADTDPERDAAAVRAPEERTFDWRGWVLVGVIVVAFLVVPGIILALPYIAGPGLDAFGLTWRDTFLVLPLIPAFALGLAAVWATTRP